MWRRCAGACTFARETAAMPGITVCEVLGEGTYGRVYRARTEAGDIVCVKEFKASDADSGMVSVSTIRELQALREIRHPNVVE